MSRSAAARHVAATSFLVAVTAVALIVADRTQVALPKPAPSKADSMVTGVLLPGSRDAYAFRTSPGPIAVSAASAGFPIQAEVFGPGGASLAFGGSTDGSPVAFKAELTRDGRHVVVIRSGDRAGGSYTFSVLGVSPLPALLAEANDLAEVFQARGGSDRSGVQSADPLLAPLDPRVRLMLGEALSPAIARDQFAFLGIHNHVRALDLEQDLTVWTADLGESVRASPAIVGDVVLAVTDQQLHALDFSSGVQRWRVPIQPGAQTPLAIGATALVGGADGMVRAINAYTGAEMWNVAAPGPIAGPLASSEDLTIVATTDGAVQAVDPNAGVLLWTSETHEPLIDGPVMSEGLVFVTSQTSVTALSPIDGMTVWSAELGVPIVASPAAAFNELFVSTSDRELVALDAASGIEKWRHPLPGEIVGAPAVYGDTVAVLTGEGRIHVVDAFTGGCRLDRPGFCEARWESWIPGRPDPTSSLVAVGDDYILNVPPFILVLSAD
ncbi:MAG: PQQ-binding-like beta-propeller repeat protein [Acidimicrobiia bacterium]